MNEDRLEFHIEQLECRQLLAGNVIAVITASGDLKITGDNESNLVTVSEMDSNALQLSPDSGTAINGGALGETAILHNPGALRDLRIDMKGGDDTIVVQGLSFRNGIAKGGSGNDGIFFLDDVEFTGNLKIFLDSGVNGEGSFSGFDQNVTQLGNVEGKTTIKGSATHDLISLESVHGHKLTVATRGGDDAVMLTGITAKNSVNINLGSGDDGLRLAHSTFLAKAKFDGGAGTNEVVASGISSFVASGISSFLVRLY